MSVSHEFLTNLAIVLVVAGITSVLFQRLRLPVIFGYLLAGFMIGPHFVWLPIVADEATVHSLSELGVILLIFALGLEFNLRRLIRVGSTSGIIALGETTLLAVLGYLAASAFGWTTMESVFTGALVAVSSTTIIAKAFEEQRVKERFVDIVLGVLVVEDLIAILFLAVLTAVATAGTFSSVTVGVTAARLAVFLAGFLVIGLLVIPRFMRYLVAKERPETLVVATVGLAFASALIAQRFGYSVALGSFLAGAIAAESGVARSLQRAIVSVRDLFAAIFFVSVGMLIQPNAIAEHWVAVLVLVTIVMTGKIAGVTISSFLTGHGVRTSVQAGMSLAQIGEFSFIIAGVGVATGAIRPFFYPVAVAVSALTTLTTPLLIRWSTPAAKYIDRKLPRPLQTFVALYGCWVERMRPAALPPARHRFVRLIGLIVLDATLIAVLVIGVAVELPALTRFLVDIARVKSTVAQVVVLLSAAALAVPLVMGLFRTARFLGLALAQRAFQHHAGVDYAAAARRALVTTVQLGVIMFVGILLAALTHPFVPAGGTLGAIAIAVMVSTFSFWRSATNLHGHAQAGAQVFAAALAKQLPADASSQPGNALATASSVLEGLGEPTTMRVQPGSIAAGQTLAQLNLRGLTGAIVLAIRRADSEVALPNGHEMIYAGDVMAVTGTHAALRAARKLLAEPPS
jgi:CPA2 family monovalent cation:H+ antiporter-2